MRRLVGVFVLLQRGERCFDLTPPPSILSPFFTSPRFPGCRWNSSFSFKSYCICPVLINLSLSLSYLPFRLPLLPRPPAATPRYSLHPSCNPPHPPSRRLPATAPAFPKSSAIRHLGPINYTVLCAAWLSVRRPPGPASNPQTPWFTPAHSLGKGGRDWRLLLKRFSLPFKCFSFFFLFFTNLPPFHLPLNSYLQLQTPRPTSAFAKMTRAVATLTDPPWQSFSPIGSLANWTSIGGILSMISPEHRDQANWRINWSCDSKRREGRRLVPSEGGQNELD